MFTVRTLSYLQRWWDTYKIFICSFIKIIIFTLFLWEYQKLEFTNWNSVNNNRAQATELFLSKYFLQFWVSVTNHVEWRKILKFRKNSTAIFRVIILWGRKKFNIFFGSGPSVNDEGEEDMEELIGVQSGGSVTSEASALSHWPLPDLRVYQGSKNPPQKWSPKMVTAIFSEKIGNLQNTMRLIPESRSCILNTRSENLVTVS
jgi:hypothetical protein